MAAMSALRNAWDFLGWYWLVVAMFLAMFAWGGWAVIATIAGYRRRRREPLPPRYGREAE